MRKDFGTRTHPVALAVTLVLAMTLIATAAAQRAGGAATQAATEQTRPGWLPRAISDSAWRQLTVAERVAFTARWSEYDRLFATQDSLARPEGFTVGPFAAGGLDDPSSLPQFDYGLVVFTGAVRTRGEGPALLTVAENPSSKSVWVVSSGGATFSDAQGDMFLERPRQGPLPGMPAHAIVFGAPLQFGSTDRSVENALWVLLTANGEVPWGDVPRERVLKILIAQEQTALNKLEQALSNSDYRKMVEAIDPAQPARILADAKGRVARVTGELAAMSPAERAAPAWIQVTHEGTYAFAAPGTAGFQHLIADKPDYYRASGWRTQLRAMLIGFRLTNGFRKQEDRAVEDSYKAFDWAAAARLLTTPASR